jgi:NADH-quinone oxidoreductase subunit L
MIIWESFASVHGGVGFWLVAVTGAMFTSVYTFRMVFLTFGGKVKTPVHHVPGLVMTLPLVVLAVFSLVAGFMETPGNLGNIHGFSRFLLTCLPETHISQSREHSELMFQLIASVTGISGILAAIWLYRPKEDDRTPFNLPEPVRSFFEKGWCFDQLYDALFVKPYVTFAQINRHDAVDQIYNIAARLTQAGNRLLTLTQNGRLRTYAWGIGLGAAAVIALVVFL